MNDISKDLIKFVEEKRPEVLPGIKLIKMNTGYVINYTGGLDHISDVHVSAMLVNWLVQELKVHDLNILSMNGNWIVFTKIIKNGTFFHHREYRKELLMALWQTYKAVKGIM